MSAQDLSRELQWTKSQIKHWGDPKKQTRVTATMKQDGNV